MRQYIAPFLLVLLVVAGVWFPFLHILVVIFVAERLVAKKYALTFIISTLLSILCVAAAVALLSLLLDIFIPTEKQFRIMEYILLVGGLLLLYFNRKTIKPVYRISRQEMTSSLLALAAMIFLLVPALHTKNSSDLIRFLSSGEDNASHFAMFNYSIIKESPPYLNHGETGLIGTLDTYPQGPQSFYGFSYWSILGDRAYSPKILLALYYLMNVTICGALVFIVGQIVQFYAKPRLKVASAIIATSSAFIGSILFLIGWGFITQLAALVYVLFVIYFIAGLSNDKRNEISTGTIAMLGLLLTGLSFAWYLMILVVLVALIPFFIKIVRTKNISLYVSSVVAGMAAFSPILLNLVASGGESPINQPGGVYKYEILGYSVIAIGLALFIYLYITKKAKTLMTTSIMLFVISSFVLSGLVALYQLLSIHTLEYYFFKSLFLLMIISIVMLTVFTSYAFTRKLKKKSSFIYISAGALSAFVIALLIINPIYPRVYFNNWFNHQLLPETLIVATESFSSTHKPQDIMYSIPCNHIREYTADRWVGALYLSEEAERGKLESKAFYSSTSQKEIMRYVVSRPGALLVSQPCEK